MRFFKATVFSTQSIIHKSAKMELLIECKQDLQAMPRSAYFLMCHKVPQKTWTSLKVMRNASLFEFP